MLTWPVFEFPTIAEARTIALLNAQDSNGPGQGAHFLLGGTTIHNSKSFLDMIQDAASRFPSSITRPPQNTSTTTPTLNLGIAPVRQGQGGTASSIPNPFASSSSSSPFTSEGGRGVLALSGQGSILDPGRLGEVTENARDIASGLFGRLRGAVDGISLQ